MTPSVEGDTHSTLHPDLREAEAEHPKVNHPEISAVHIKRFQDRSRFHFYISYLVLLLLFVLFALCWYIFFRAQDIDRSSTSPSLFQQLQVAKRYQDAIVSSSQAALSGLKEESVVGQRSTNDVLDAEFRLAEARAKQLLLAEKERLMLEVGYFSDVESTKSREELGAQLKAMNDHHQTVLGVLEQTKKRLDAGEVTSTDVAQAERFVAESGQKKALLEQKFKVAPAAAELKNATVSVDTLELVRTSLIRFGGVAVVLFLMSVLVPIYRYNVRLGTYYLARADTLILFRDAKVENFGEMINLLTPALEFDKEPRTPVDAVSAIVKEAAATVARRV
jgi:hypothetical protein